MTTSEFDASAAHRHFATDCFNRVWELLEKPDRSADEDRMMVAMSHASLFHWQQRTDCTPRNLSVGYWLISRVYAVLGQADNAREFAQHCGTSGHDQGAFYLGYAHEAAARAEFLAGNWDAGEHFLAEAHSFVALVTNVDERDLLHRDLETMKPVINSNRQRLTNFELDAVRQALLADIHQVFRTVSREGGVSWGKSVLIDNYGWQGDRPPRPDDETHWSQLVNDETWVPSPGVGGFSFLDAIGFRYYLPPAMIRCLQSGYDEGIQFHLGEPHAELQQYKCEQLSLLDHDQRRCVARFLLYMARRSDEPYLTGNAKDEWLKTLNAGWWQHLEADSPLPIE